MLLHYQNWRRLQQPREARKSLIWLVCCLTLVGVTTWYAFGVAHDVNVFRGYCALIAGPMLLLWYMLHGRRQSLLLVPLKYPRRPLWLAGWAGVFVVIGFWVAVHFAFNHAITLEQRVADLAEQVSAQGRVRVDDQTWQLKALAEGPKLAMIMQVYGVQITPEMLANAPRRVAWQVCNNTVYQPLLEQGMILEMRYVSPEGEPLGKFQMTREDCARYSSAV
jgi:hypothetical protein